MTLLIIIALVVMSGLFSGLTLGLLSLNKTELERKIKLGDQKARKIYEVRKDGNLLLCTLLMGNVLVNSILAIFLGSLASGVVASLVATGLILVFGEILPQAVFSRYAMWFGTKLVWLVKIFEVLFYVICKPLALMLNKGLGEELSTTWSKRELEMIVSEHEDNPHSEIDQDEERILLGALRFSDKKVKDIMTPKEKAYLISNLTFLNPETLFKIKDMGYSRIPVYQNSVHNVIGILHTKDLIGLEKNTMAKDLVRKENLFVISENMRLDTLLRKFLSQKRRTHLACVYNKEDKLSGIISLEDLLEEIIGKEIMDEYDI